ncbi:AAA family ATPase [candidate division WWE3 bacterium]|uniref:Adenylate kinase n=1 Tax=candidate division WWE3 bacterium TaxID=2053526 RepID=A0A7X9HGK0_UNCKA|nr:AAA family ATPase [candidate division WWE3 bacterium]
MMGPQACGKGTQGRMLSAALGIPLVTNGELLRNLSDTHPYKKLISSQMNKGELVDQKFVAQIIKDRISKPDCANGYILDGWMRKDIDLDYFYPPLDYVILITLPREESLKRISGRRVCDLDGKTVNILTQDPEEFEYCDGHLSQRPDDNENAVNRRLDIFYTDTMHVINQFKAKNKVIEVSGLGTPEEVFSRIEEQLVKKGVPLQ